MAEIRERGRGRGRAPALIVAAIAIAAVAYGAYRVSHRSHATRGPAHSASGGTSHAASASAKPESKAEAGVPGRAEVKITPERQQLIGVVTARVAPRRMEQAVRTVGVVQVDEELQSEVYSKVEGWIEKLYANQTGKMVRKGEPLLTIYSPDLVSAQEEYLVALRSRDRLAKSPFPEVQESGESLVAAARERLRLWDVGDQDVRRLEETGQVRKTLTLYSPNTGYILEKQVVAGSQVGMGMPLYKLAGLSRVWVDADIYEYEAPRVKVGQEARLTMDAHPGRALSGRVKYIYPTVETETRTLKARFEFSNPGLALKPGMFANVEILSPQGEQLAIPEMAVIDTGTRKVVFVKVDEGTLVPREVTLGNRSAGYYPVIAGLKGGEEVVSSANFLVDSESQFRAAVEAMKAGHAMAGM